MITTENLKRQMDSVSSDELTVLLQASPRGVSQKNSEKREYWTPKHPQKHKNIFRRMLIKKQGPSRKKTQKNTPTKNTKNIFRCC